MSKNEKDKRIYELLKSNLIQTNKVINSSLKEGVQLTEQELFVKDLNTSFNEIMDNRKEALVSFDTLLLKKSSIFQNLLSAISAEFYSTKINNNTIQIMNILDLLSIINSEVTQDNIRKYLNILGTNLNSISTEVYEKQTLISYFDNQLTQLISFIKPSIIKADIGTDTFIELGVTEEEYKILFLFYKLSLSSTITQNDYSEVTLIADELFYPRGAGSKFIFSFYNRLNKLMKQVIDYSKSFEVIEEYRKIKDPAYSDDYIRDIKGFFDELATELVKISDVFSITSEQAEMQGVYNTINTINLNIRNSVENFMDEFLDSVKLIDNYIENYFPFINPMSLITDIFSGSIKVLEDITINTISELDFLPNDFNERFTPLYDSGPTIERFSLWIKSASAFINAEVYDLFIMYAALQIKKIESAVSTGKLDANIIKRMTNYAFLSMSKRNEIPVENINNTFRNVVEKEKNLEINYKIKVAENVNDDMIPSTLKILLPGLEAIDFIDFNNYLKNEDAENFEKTIIFFIIEEMSKRKKNINNIIRNAVNVFTQNKINFKTVFTEYAIRKALEKLIRYLSDETNPLVEYDNLTGEISNNQTVLDASTIFLLDSFVSGNTFSKTITDQIIADYKVVWNFFYSSSTPTLIDLALKDGPLKNFLNR
jgi:hypothetical protein